MSTSKLKPTGWYYVLALLIPVFACMGTTLLVYRNVPKLPGAIEATGIQHLTQVVVPGSAEIHFPESGAYAVYYEYRSVIDGMSYARDEYPPSMRCQLRSKRTGEAVRLAPSNVKGNVYTTHYPERAGVMFKRISIDQPGIYNLSCQYPDGRTHPQIVLAVGPNIIWELFNIAAKPLAALTCGAIIFMGAFCISILIMVIVAYKRNQYRKILG